MTNYSSAPSAASGALRRDWCALAIVALACAFRFYRLDVPFVDGHNWRQVTNADIARLWTDGPIDLFYPSVSWGGPDGRVGMEFPLLHLLMALAWRAVGISDNVGRLVPAAFSVLTVWFTYRVGTRLFDRPTGRGAAFVMAVSPTVVYFGRTPLSDTPMLCFSVASVLGYLAYAQEGRRRYALGGATALALAGLVKLPAILVLGPALWTGFALKGVRRTLLDPWYVSTALAAVGAIGLWYLHADQIYLETGLTQAIFRPSGTYSPEIEQYAGYFTTVSHWTQRELLTWATAGQLTQRFWSLHLTPAPAIAAVLGACTWRWPLRKRSIVDVWILAGLSFVLVSLTGQLPHEFHQLPMLPPLALYAGLGAAPLFDDTHYRRLAVPLRTLAITAMTMILTAGALYGFSQSGVIRRLYRPDQLNIALIDAGEVIERMTPPSALIITIEYDRYGSNSPMLLYFSHRKGWSFDGTSISIPVIDHLRAKYGACYVALNDWYTLKTQRPEVVEWLLAARPIELLHTHSQFRLFDVGCGS